MNPILLLLVAAVLGGIAVWFRSNISGRGETDSLFMAWLITGSLAALCAAVSFWIPDTAISLSFFVAYRVLISFTVFVLFVFARSFSHRPDYTLLFWSLPLMFDVAQIIVNGGNMLREAGNSYVLDLGNPFTVAHVTIFAFYMVLSVYYLFVLYLELKRVGRERERRQVLFFFSALLIMLSMMVLETLIRSWLEVNILLGGIGVIAGAVLMVQALRGHFLGEAEET